MSADAATQNADAAAEGGAPGKKKGKKKLLLVAPVVLALVVAGLWFGGILPPLLGMGGDAKAMAKADGKDGKDGKGGKAEAAAEPPTFIDMPEIIANLNSNPRRPSFVKLHIKLELAKAADAAPMQAAMPKLMDLFQTYLREMRPEEFRGSAGTYRLREELIARASLVAPPAQVQDVLFTEMIVQ